MVGAPLEPLDSVGGALAVGEARNTRMAVGYGEGFAGHAGVFEVRGSAGDDREVSAGEGEGGVCADGEREGGVSGGADDVRLRVGIDEIVIRWAARRRSRRFFCRGDPSELSASSDQESNLGWTRGEV